MYIETAQQAQDVSSSTTRPNTFYQPAIDAIMNRVTFAARRGLFRTGLPFHPNAEIIAILSDRGFTFLFPVYVRYCRISDVLIVWTDKYPVS